jgi:hypothetical protein
MTMNVRMTLTTALLLLPPSSLGKDGEFDLAPAGDELRLEIPEAPSDPHAGFRLTEPQELEVPTADGLPPWEGLAFYLDDPEEPTREIEPARLTRPRGPIRDLYLSQVGASLRLFSRAFDGWLGSYVTGELTPIEYRGLDLRPGRFTVGRGRFLSVGAGASDGGEFAFGVTLVDGEFMLGITAPLDDCQIGGTLDTQALIQPRFVGDRGEFNFNFSAGIGPAMTCSFPHGTLIVALTAGQAFGEFGSENTRARFTTTWVNDDTYVTARIAYGRNTGDFENENMTGTVVAYARFEREWFMSGELGVRYSDRWGGRNEVLDINASVGLLCLYDDSSR